MRFSFYNPTPWLLNIRISHYDFTILFNFPFLGNITQLDIVVWDYFRSRPETPLLTPESLFIFVDDQTISAYIDAISNRTIKPKSSCSRNPVGSEPDRTLCPNRQDWRTALCESMIRFLERWTPTIYLQKYLYLCFEHRGNKSKTCNAFWTLDMRTLVPENRCLWNG